MTRAPQRAVRLRLGRRPMLGVPIELGTYPDGNPAVLSPADRRRHLYLVGKTGTGKSTLLQSLMRDDLQQGRGFALLDPHGDLAEAVAAATPAWRVNDVVYLDPADVAFPIGFNPLGNVAADARPLVAAQITGAFQHIWGASWGPRLEYILMNALRLLLEAPGSTLLGLPRVLANADYRDRLLAHCPDPVVRAFWIDEFARYPDRLAAEAVAPVQNKIGALLSPPALRNMLGQPRSTLHIRRLMDRGHVLICNLAKGRLGPAPAHLLGALLVTSIAQAAEARVDMPEAARRDFTLYADEFQNFATDSFASILSEARKYRLALVLAHQFLGQLPTLLRQAVTGNAGSIVAFRVGTEDAAVLADELGIESRGALTDAPNFIAWVKLIANGVPGDARPIATHPPAASPRNRIEDIRDRTRARYARPRSAVEDRIPRFLAGRNSADCNSGRIPGA